MQYKIVGFIFIFLLRFLTVGDAQTNPYDGFATIESGQGARNSGLSETNGAEPLGDFDSWSVNPANLSPASWSNVALHSSFSPGSIHSFSVNGLVSRDTIWPLALGLSRTTFGRNTRYDAEGNAIGEFNASVSQLSVGSRRQLSEHFYLGTALHYNWRTIDFFNSHILHFSIGGIYKLDERTSYGFNLSHLGYEIVPFSKKRNELPMDLSLFWGQRLNYLPFTFFLRLQKLNLWNRTTFENPFQTGSQNLNEPVESSSRIKDFTEELLRHMVLGGEFSFGQPAKVWLRFSYDHWKNQQLGIPGIRSLEGVAVGFGLQLKMLRVDYTWERLYFDVGSHQISVAIRLFDKDRRQRGF